MAKNNGEPQTGTVPDERPNPKRQLGWAKGEFIVPDDFDEPLPGEALFDIVD